VRLFFLKVFLWLVPDKKDFRPVAALPERPSQEARSEFRSEAAFCLLA